MSAGKTREMSGSKVENGLANGTEEVENGPGLVYMPFVVMEDLLDKLKLLNYEQEFVKALKMRALTRHYFVLQTNPGEQFYLFTSLSAWLIRKSGARFEQPQEFDDPNATLASILEHVRRMNITVDFAPSRLKQGYGEHAIFVLDRLADNALKATSFEWQKPIIKAMDDSSNEMERGDGVEYNDDDDVDEVDLDRVEEQMLNEMTDDDDENDGLHIDELVDSKLIGSTTTRPEAILASHMDTDAWRLEVERVAPQLKVLIRSDERDWRHHLEQMHDYRLNIDKALQETQSHLQRLQVDVNRGLEKIGSREKFLNAQLENQLKSLRVQSDALTATKEQYRAVSSGVSERTAVLAQINDDLEAIKNEMEERGASMTDGSPLVNIKRALTRMRNEQRIMDVRMGVLEHSLLQAQLRAKSNWHREANRGQNSNGDNSNQDNFFV